MVASSFVKAAARGMKDHQVSGKIGSHHKPSDSKSSGMAHKVTAPVRIVGKGSMKKGK
jgi:hypothetical protein